MAPQPPSYRRVSYVLPLPTEPPPRLALPPLGTPRNGSVRPLLVHAPVSTSKSTPQSSSRYLATKSHPRHRLGVSSLALDTSTQLTGRSAPEGILYSGGRDGQIIAWDLRLRMKKRLYRYGSAGGGGGLRRGRWEVLTGWSDGDGIEEDDDLEDYDVVGGDGDVLGDVVNTDGRKRRKSEAALAVTIPYEDSWEFDVDDAPAPPSAFRQCIQTHTDWVNDILLCNLNQTVVSASSDGSIRAWSPHLSSPTDPALVGTHDDYVRCLSASPHQTWVASGSFDHTIKLWDISRTFPSIPTPPDTHPSTPAPLSTLSLPSPSQKASVYSLTTDQYGSVIASGSPERVVRIWDPRTSKRTGKLVGHTDIIRAVVLSADGRYLLTGSADASIKLWSLAAQRCLHTFAHHTDSVWALSSQHPSLEIFYSGDRSGIVSRVDMEGCNTIDEGECLVICNATRTSEDDNNTVQDQAGGSRVVNDGFRLQDSTGVNKIVALDDRLLWVATGSSDINRWKAPSRRALRLDTTGMLASPESTAFAPSLLSNSRRTSESSDVRPPHDTPSTATSPTTPHSMKNFPTSNILHPGEDEATHHFGIPYQSLVRLVSPESLGSPLSPGFGGVRRHASRDTGIATLYSAASVKSVPVSAPRSAVPPLSPAPALRPSFRQDTAGTITSRLMAVPTEPQEENWISTPRAKYNDRDLAAAAIPLESEPEETIQGDDGLVRAIVLNDRMHVLTVNTCGYVCVWDIARCRCVGWFDRANVFAAMGCSLETDRSSTPDQGFRSPRELLEMVRERIEGESVIASWATADTTVGNLTIHLSERCFDTEIYADEAGYGSERSYDTDQRLIVAKWILSNLFEKFVREEMMKLRRPPLSHSHGANQRIISHDPFFPSAPSPVPNTRKRSESVRSSHSARSIVSAIVADASMTPAIVPDVSLVNARRDNAAASTPFIPIVSVKEAPLTSASASQSGSSPAPAGLMVNTKFRREASDTPSLSKSLTGKDNDHFKRLSSTSASEDFSGWTGPGAPKDKEKDSVPQTPSTPSGGGFMGRLRQLGKSSKRPGSGEIASSPGGQLASRNSEGAEEGRKGTPRTSSEPETEQSRFLTSLIGQSFHPPSHVDAPPLNLPPDTEVILAEETQSGWTNIYRGTVVGTGADAAVLENIMPLWLMQYLLTNKIPLVPNIKVSFGVAPYPGQGDGTSESSPTRLTASRYLRVRKIMGYVQDKIDRPTSRSTSRSDSISGATPRSGSISGSTPRSSSEAAAGSLHRSSVQKLDTDVKKARPEDIYELLCNDTVLPLNMTLASVRHYIWRSSAELVLFYRRKG